MASIRLLPMLILTLMTASAGADVVVHTRQGDVLVGRQVTSTATHVYVSHRLLGIVKLPLADVTSIKGQPTQTQALPPTGPVTSDPMVDAVLAQAAGPKPPWTGGIGLALTASRAAQDTFNMRLSTQLDHVDDTGKASLRGSWYVNATAGSITDNDALIRGERQWTLNRSPFEWFLQGTWQYDQFELWEHRVSPYTGLGYKVIDRDDAELLLKGGGGATWEYGTGLLEPQLLVEADARMELTPRHSIKGYVSIAPNINDMDDYLATLRVELQVKLHDDDTLALTVGLRNIYDSMPGAGSSGHDLKVWTGLNWSF